MPRIEGTSHAQTIFLRAFLKSPTGPDPGDWPTSGVLRRWLRRPAFLLALERVTFTDRFRADLHLSAAASSAAHSLELLTNQNALAAPPNLADPTLDLQIKNQNSKIKNAAAILRLSHLRQRFAQHATTEDQKSKGATAPQLTREQEIQALQAAIRILTRGYPKMTLEEAGQYWDSQFESLLADFQHQKNNPAPAQFSRDLK